MSILDQHDADATVTLTGEEAYKVGLCLAALDLAVLPEHPGNSLAESAAYATVRTVLDRIASLAISDGLRERLGVPVVDGDDIASMYRRQVGGGA